MTLENTSSASSIEGLVTELEGLGIDPQSVVSHSVDEFLARRQAILTQIQNADASRLSPEQRAGARTRIEKILFRDRQLLQELDIRREELKKSLSQVTQGRQTARGYRQGLPIIRKALRSVA